MMDGTSKTTNSWHKLNQFWLAQLTCLPIRLVVLGGWSMSVHWPNPLRSGALRHFCDTRGQHIWSCFILISLSHMFVWWGGRWRGGIFPNRNPGAWNYWKISQKEVVVPSQNIHHCANVVITEYKLIWFIKRAHKKSSELFRLTVPHITLPCLNE